jgi:hypothetical protein
MATTANDLATGRFSRPLGIFLGTMLLAVCAHAATVESASSDQKRAAQKVFEAGDELYESGRYEEASQAFRASYELVSSPNSRLMWARALRELKRFDEACAQYQGTIRDAQASGGRYPDAQKAAQAELDALAPYMAFIVINTSPDGTPTELRINGRVVTWSPGERIAVPASKIDIDLRWADGNIRHDEIELAAGETRQLNPKPVVKPQPEKPPAVRVAMPTPQAPEPKHEGHATRNAAYVAGAVGAAGLGTFAVFGLLDRSTHSNLESKCSGGICPDSQMSDIDKGRRYQLVANIGLAVAAAGTATSVVLFVVSSSNSSHERAASLMVGPSSLALAGRF